MGANANFPTWDGQHYQGGSSSTTTFSFGNCRVNTNASGLYPLQCSNIAFPTSGKWYVELNNIVTSGYHVFGIINEKQDRYGDMLLDGTGAYQYQAWNGQKRGNGGSSTSYGSSWQSVGDVIGMAFDMDTGKIYWSKNGTFQGSGDPANGTNPAFTVPTDTQYYFGWSDYYTGQQGTVHINCGQDSSFGGSKTSGSANAADGNGIGDFYYTPPTGFLSLASASLPLATAIDPAETNDDYVGDKQCNAIVYTGNDGTTSNNINYGFKPDMVIHKDLDGIGGGYPPQVWDTTRGDDYYMYPTGTAASVTSGSDYLEFTSTGVKLDNNWDGINHNGGNYVSFGWRANGGTTSTNNEGNHTSTVQANTNAGFSIISYANYTSASGVTVGHGLNQAPDFYIHKATANTSNWNVYHKDLGATKALVINSLAGEATAVGYWANTEPTADVLSLGNGLAGTGAGIVYAWHQVEGFSKFGMYEGSGSTTGSYIHCGFKPKIVWIKKSSGSSTTYGWPVFIDDVNDNVNKAQFRNFWLDTYVGAGNNYPLDFLSNGFRHRNNNVNLDASGSTYVYMAWASVPAKYSNAF